jgi:lipopolysaccharide cholinephosphotransferase
MYEIEQIHKELLGILKYVDKTLRNNGLWYSLAYGSVLGAVRHKGFIPWDADVDIYILINEREKVRKVLKANLPAEYEYLDASCDNVTVFDNIRSRVYGDFAQLDIYVLVGAPDVSRWSDGKQKRILLTNKIWVKLTCAKYGDHQKVHNILKRVPFLFVKGVMHLIPNSYIRRLTTRREEEYNIETSPYLYSLVVYDRIEGYMNRDIYLQTSDSIFEDIIIKIPTNYHIYLKAMYGDDYMTPKRT